MSLAGDVGAGPGTTWSRLKTRADTKSDRFVLNGNKMWIHQRPRGRYGSWFSKTDLN